jgi:plastocyanin/uncharacterized membrane protein
MVRKGLSILICGLIATALAADIGLSAQSDKAAGATTHTVVIRQMRFNPPQLTVQPGDVVEWKNEDIFSHSATADDGSFDSGLIAPGRSWQTTIRGAGTIGFHCRPHPNMTGSLVVSSGAAPPGKNATAVLIDKSFRTASLKWRPPMSPEEIHPVLVNFTASLLPLGLLSDLLGVTFRRKSLHDAGFWMVVYAAAITPLTAAAGWWWRHGVGSTLPPGLIAVHQWLGTSAAVLFVLLAVWRWKIKRAEAVPGAAYLLCAAALVAALVYQGSLGGSMVFGR